MLNASKKTFSCMTVRKASGTPVSRKPVAYAGMRLCFVLHGEAEWQINGKLCTVKAGDIVFLSNRQNRCFTRYGAEGFILCAFTLERQAFSNMNHFSFFLSCTEKSNGILHSSALTELLTEVYREYTEASPVSYELISALLTEFFIRAERHMHFDIEAAVKMDKAMLQVLDYIDAHITEKISLSEVSKMVGFTESSFSRRFAKLNGISFKKYVMSKKIAHAIYLLETTEEKVIDVAFECGFDSISGFYDTFRKVTGTTPNKYTYIV